MKNTTMNTGAASLSDERERAAITACALMIKGICLTRPNAEWTGAIEDRIQFMLKQMQADAAIAAGGAQEAMRTLPQPVIDALRFYAHGHHFNIDDDHQQFDTVSGEPQNWLMSEREDDCTMIEDGSIAKAVLLGGLPGFEEPTEPLEGEVFAALLPRVAAAVPDGDARYIVIGYGETDHPQAAFINEREQLLDAVLGMMYTHASNADPEIREAYAKDLTDDDEWSEGIWSTEFEIGGITIYDLGYGSAASNGEQ